MKTRRNRQGSAVHIIIVGVLVLALLGALGAIVWKNLANQASDDDATKANNTTTASSIYDGWSAYTFKDTGTSFRYPSTWTVEYSAPSEEDNRATASLMLIYDPELVLPSNVGDFLWPSVEIYDNREVQPTLDGEVIYSEKVANSRYLVCSYHEGAEVRGGPVVQRMRIDLVDKDFDLENPEASSTIVSAERVDLVINGGYISYQDGSLPRDVAKQLCASPKAGDYTTQVIQWLKSFEF